MYWGLQESDFTQVRFCQFSSTKLGFMFHSLPQDGVILLNAIKTSISHSGKITWHRWHFLVTFGNFRNLRPQSKAVHKMVSAFSSHWVKVRFLTVNLAADIWHELNRFFFSIFGLIEV